MRPLNCLEIVETSPDESLARPLRSMVGGVRHEACGEVKGSLLNPRWTSAGPFSLRARVCCVSLFLLSDLDKELCVVCPFALGEMDNLLLRCGLFLNLSTTRRTGTSEAGKAVILGVSGNVSERDNKIGGAERLGRYHVSCRWYSE